MTDLTTSDGQRRVPLRGSDLREPQRPRWEDDTADVIPGRGTAHPEYYALIRELVNLTERKAADYGGGDPWGNFNRARDLGVDPSHGILIRMSDKWSRLCSLMRDGSDGLVVDETLEDTLLDLGNYALLLVAMRRDVAHREQRDRELEVAA